jgi:ribonuclease HI
MELTAAIEGLKALKRPCKVTLFSDSRYLVDTMARNWRRNANQDLWEELDKLVETHEVTWWLPRNSTPELTECDPVAKEQSLITS